MCIPAHVCICIQAVLVEDLRTHNVHRVLYITTGTIELVSLL